MALQFVGLGVTITSIGVSLRSSVGPMPWMGESLLGTLSISTASVIPSSLIGNSSAALMFDVNSNSQYIGSVAIL